jgi:hypothetical protein
VVAENPPAALFYLSKLRIAANIDDIWAFSFWVDSQNPPYTRHAIIHLVQIEGVFPFLSLSFLLSLSSIIFVYSSLSYNFAFKVAVNIEVNFEI